MKVAFRVARRLFGDPGKLLTTMSANEPAPGELLFATETEPVRLPPFKSPVCTMTHVHVPPPMFAAGGTGPIQVPATENQDAEPKEQPSSMFSPDGELVVDVFETNNEFVVLTAIAGVQIKDLDISMKNSQTFGR